MLIQFSLVERGCFEDQGYSFAVLLADAPDTRFRDPEQGVNGPIRSRIGYRR